MPITFACSQCNQRYQVDDSLAGKSIQCKKCGAVVGVPDAGQEAPADVFDLGEPPPMGQSGGPNPYAPPRAPTGANANGPRPPQGGDDAVATLIPYKNSSALTGYYLGVFGIAFSCLPLFGLILPIIAVILGLKGLKYVKQYPEAHGTGHAWIAIVTGSIGILLQVAEAIGFVVMVAYGSRGH